MALSCTGERAGDLVSQDFAFADQQLRYALTETENVRISLGKTPEELPSPRNIQSDGSLRLVRARDWCSGFFPGVLWYLYENNKGSEELFDYANLYTKRIEKEQFNTSTHDLGFMLYCSYGNGFRLNPTSESEGVLINGAHALSARYNPVVKCIRSWNKWRDYSYPVIIDNMMNLEMLMWACLLYTSPSPRDTR